MELAQARSFVKVFMTTVKDNIRLTKRLERLEGTTAKPARKNAAAKKTATKKVRAARGADDEDAPVARKKLGPKALAAKKERIAARKAANAAVAKKGPKAKKVATKTAGKKTGKVVKKAKASKGDDDWLN